MNKGKLIVFEGIDGAGKTTQIKLLAEYLKGKNIDFEVINFPRYGQNLYADLVTRYLKGEFGNINEINPYLAALAYAGDRALSKPLIENWLNNGKLVISNRYVSASQAHLSANLPENQVENFIKWVDQLEYQTNKMPKPHFTILLKVDPGIGQENVLKSGQIDIHEKSLTHEQKGAQIYLKLAEDDWIVVDCMKYGKIMDKENIHQQVIALLEKYL